MKTVRDIKTPDVVWVYPSAKVKHAIIVMKGHNIGALPVVTDNSAVCGWLDDQTLLGEDPTNAVADIMKTDFTTVSPELTVHEAAELMTNSGASHLLVVEEERLIGILSHADLLPELGKSFDPLTGLPWSDALRNWAINALKWGMEISLTLIDLNKFGAFNKKYGHVVGDNVLKAVSEVLKAGMDPEKDFLCRYGGDEFAIASIRMADDALAFGDKLIKNIAQIEVPDLPEGVTASFGMAGGRRTKERDDMHYASTLDDLINRASRNCTANKPQEASAPAGSPGTAQSAFAEPKQEGRFAAFAEETPNGRRTSAMPASEASRLKISRLSVSSVDVETSVEVELSRKGTAFAHKVSGYTVAGRNALRLAAEAAAGAVSKSMEAGYGIVVDQVFSFEPVKDQQIVSVTAVFVTPQHNITHVGSALVRRGDIYRAAVSALLSAVNRLVSMAPSITKVQPHQAQAPQEHSSQEQASKAE
jgi:diguanylate cyclase (GGDEF)-like protein